MHWRRTDPVQEVGALIVTGADRVEALIGAMAGKSDLIRSLPCAHGEAWAVLFAGAIPGETGAESVLPRLPGATPLYEAAPGWWLPVGVALEAPAHMEAGLLAAMARRAGVKPPVVVVPAFADGDRTAEAEAYAVETLLPYLQCGLETRPGGARRAG